MVRSRLWNIWKRGLETGPIIREKEFDMKLYRKLNELVKAYGIKYDPEAIVPTDDSLIDDVFNAAVDLMLNIGVLCTNTQRLIKFEESEIKEMLKTCRKPVTLGEGKEAVTLTLRTLEDPRPPAVLGGPTGEPITEEMAVKIYQSYAQEPIINGSWIGSPVSVDGMVAKTGSPTELQAELCNIAWARMAALKVGRPGYPFMGRAMMSPEAQITGSHPDFGFRKTDSSMVILLSELKADYECLSKALHFLEYGCPIQGWGVSYIGSYAGGVESTTIAAIAASLTEFILYQADVMFTNVLDGINVGQSGRMALWGNNLHMAALNKNGFITLGGDYITYAGPCTDMILQEVATMAIGSAVVGSNMGGIAPLQGSGRGKFDYCTGLECRFMGEVGYATVGMKRENANELVKEILPKYEEQIKMKNAPFGKSFRECYNPDTITPTREYLELYYNIKKELEDRGLKFKD